MVQPPLLPSNKLCSPFCHLNMGYTIIADNNSESFQLPVENNILNFNLIRRSGASCLPDLSLLPQIFLSLFQVPKRNSPRIEKLRLNQS